jgi:phage baseplate assembly protein W
MQDYMVINLSEPSVSTVEQYGYVAQGGYVSEVELGIPTNSSISQGLITVIQMVVKSLLTIRGTNVFNPDEGCTLMTYRGAAITPTSVKDLSIDLTETLDALLPRIEHMQDTYFIEEQERVVGLQLSNLTFNPTDTTLSVIVTLETENESFPLSIAVN